MKSTQLSLRTLARLKRQLQVHQITHDRVAAEASKTSRRGRVGKTAVSHTLAGRAKSSNVIGTIKRLIAEAKARQDVGAEQKAS